MAQQIIGVGAVADDGNGDPLRTAYIKINENFTETYGFSRIGSQAVTAGDTPVLFSSTMGTTNYQVILIDYDGNVGVKVKSGTIAATGFTIESLGSGTIGYIAIKNK